MVKGTRQAGRRARAGSKRSWECAHSEPLDTTRQKSGGPREAGWCVSVPPACNRAISWKTSRFSVQARFLAKKWEVKPATFREKLGVHPARVVFRGKLGALASNPGL